MAAALVVDKRHARRFLLSHQGLLPPRSLKGSEGVFDFIRHVNCIQQDPINVVGQNPHLVLQSRVRGYRPQMLNDLLYKDRRLIDGFDKQMSIFPTEDWPDFAAYRARRYKAAVADKQAKAAARLVKPVLDAIEARGPLSSLDLEEGPRMDWWLSGSVRASRIALDILLYGGETLVHHRVGTRRYFDLSSRLLPPKLLRRRGPTLSQDEYLEWHVLRRAGGLGLVGPKTTAAYAGMIGWRGLRAAIARLAEKGLLVPVSIAELPRQQFFVRSEDLPAFEAVGGGRRKDGAALIAPLDNLIWDLSNIYKLFDFRYAWEVYKPPHKRDYGYYVLPVLYGDRFVARVDPTYDRDSRVLTITNWWWEEGVERKSSSLLAALRECLAAFASYLGAEKIKLGSAVKRNKVLVEVMKG
jgi:uncharacterized protein